MRSEMVVSVMYNKEFSRSKREHQLAVLVVEA